MKRELLSLGNVYILIVLIRKKDPIGHFIKDEAYCWENYNSVYRSIIYNQNVFFHGLHWFIWECFLSRLFKTAWHRSVLVWKSQTTEKKTRWPFSMWYRQRTGTALWREGNTFLMSPQNWWTKEKTSIFCSREPVGWLLWSWADVVSILTSCIIR